MAGVETFDYSKISEVSIAHFSVNEDLLRLPDVEAVSKGKSEKKKKAQAWNKQKANTSKVRSPFRTKFRDRRP